MQKYDDIMTFGSAIDAMKQGNKVARKGWSCKEMCLAILTSGKIHYANIEELKIDIANVDSSSQQEYASTQDDILAEDWIIVE